MEPSSQNYFTIYQATGIPIHYKPKNFGDLYSRFSSLEGLKIRFHIGQKGIETALQQLQDRLADRITNLDLSTFFFDDHSFEKLQELFAICTNLEILDLSYTKNLKLKHIAKLCSLLAARGSKAVLLNVTESDLPRPENEGIQARRNWFVRKVKEQAAQDKSKALTPRTLFLRYWYQETLFHESYLKLRYFEYKDHVCFVNFHELKDRWMGISFHSKCENLAGIMNPDLIPPQAHPLVDNEMAKKMASFSKLLSSFSEPETSSSSLLSEKNCLRWSQNLDDNLVTEMIQKGILRAPANLRDLTLALTSENEPHATGFLADAFQMGIFKQKSITLSRALTPRSRVLQLDSPFEQESSGPFYDLSSILLHKTFHHLRAQNREFESILSLKEFAEIAPKASKHVSQFICNQLIKISDHNELINRLRSQTKSEGDFLSCTLPKLNEILDEYPHETKSLIDPILEKAKEEYFKVLRKLFAAKRKKDIERKIRYGVQHDDDFISSVTGSLKECSVLSRGVTRKDSRSVFALLLLFLKSPYFPRSKIKARNLI